jgi:hypothetical protein
MASTHTESFGLPTETRDLGFRMLNAKQDLATQRRIHSTLRRRATDAFLPNLVTSRPSAKSNSTTFGGLPGVGHPYWQTARAHNYAGSFPPHLTSDIQRAEQNPNDAQIRVTLAFLKQMWS